MKGTLLIAGGAEFRGLMALPDRRALTLAGGPQASVAIIPAAAAPDHNAQRAGRNAESWFRGLGARRVASLPLVDRASADDPDVTARLRSARLIYLLGGFPAYLADCLASSRSWQALCDAYRAGAVVAGSSAGAMVLCGHYFDPAGHTVRPGLDLLPGVCVIPHHDTFGQRWIPNLRRQLPDTLLVGIDEETATLGGGPRDLWQVYGKGRVTVYGSGQPALFGHGQAFRLA